MSPPKVSIVIPVYNVEPYLRQCLDSIVNQTLREIQTICVNDGSTDGSLAILQEYAARDSRIEIIDKPNGGLSSARNAAYPHLKGKYTLFVDSDDWIDLDTCRKTYYRAEQSGADGVFFYHYQYEHSTGKVTPIPQKTAGLCYKAVEEKKELLQSLSVTAWDKLWRSDFLIQNDILFPVGLINEDIAFFWHAIVLANKITVLPECLYYYRQRAGSIMYRFGRERLDIIKVYGVIKRELLKSGMYDSYASDFMTQKLNYLRWVASLPLTVPNKETCDAVSKSLDADDIEFLRSENDLPDEMRDFYLALLGDKQVKWRRRWRNINSMLIRPVIKQVESAIRFIAGKKKKQRPPVQSPQEQQIAQLANLISQLCEEVVRLREAQSEHEA